MALTTKDRVKSYLRINADDTTKDVVIAELVERLSKSIAGECDRIFEYQSHTEYHNGDGKFKRLNLNQYPVDGAVSFSLYDDYNRVYGSDTLIAAADYSVDYDKGIVTLDGAVPFIKGFKNIKVIYSAGYRVIPEDLERACILYVVAEFLDTQSAMQASIEIETAQRSENLRDQAQKIINRYKAIHAG